MKKVFHLTKEGVTELEAEKADLLKRRVETAEAIKNAREMGDLSENAEYQSARKSRKRTMRESTRLNTFWLTWSS